MSPPVCVCMHIVERLRRRCCVAHTIEVPASLDNNYQLNKLKNLFYVYQKYSY